MAAVPAHYARALVEVVTQPGASAAAAEKARADLRSFLEVFESSEELRNVLANPAVPAPQKRALIERLGRPLELSRTSLNFLYVLIDHRRVNLLREILNSFGAMLDQRAGIVRAEVTTAAQLDEAQRRLLEQALERMTGKQVRARFSVEPELLGGAVTRIGSTIYDGSLREQLRQLRQRLSSE